MTASTGALARLVERAEGLRKLVLDTSLDGLTGDQQRLAQEFYEFAALAPDAVRLAIDMAAELRGRYQSHQAQARDVGGGPCICEACQENVALLARFAALEEKAAQ